MPLSLTRRGRVWYVRGVVRARSSDEGLSVYESTHTEDRHLAEQARTKREQELYEELLHGRRVSERFDRAALSYLEHEPRSAATHALVHRLVAHFAALPCARIDQAACDAAVRAIAGPDAAPATKIRTVITPLTAILTHAAKRRWCDHPSFDRPSVPKTTPAWMTPAQARALVEGAAPHLRPLLVFLLCTGARLSEALYLPWDDVDLAGGRAVFRAERTKAGTERAAHLPPTAIAALLTIPQRSGMVFRRDDGEPYTPREGEGGQIKAGWKHATKRARLGAWEARILEAGPGRRWVPAFTPHDCRHTWASWHYAVNRDLLALRIEGGWHSVTMVERYAHRAPASVADEARRFWGIAGVTGDVQPAGPARIVAAG